MLPTRLKSIQRPLPSTMPQQSYGTGMLQLSPTCELLLFLAAGTTQA